MLPEGVELEPKVAYRRDPREIVVDIRLPDLGVVRVEKSVKYVRLHERFTVKERSKAEVTESYRRVLAQLPLCVLQFLFRGFAAEVLDSVTVNGILPTVERATGDRASALS